MTDYTFTPEAKEYLDSIDCDITPEMAKEFAENYLKQPSESIWHDQDLWETHTIAFGHPYQLAGPEYLINAVNLESALEYFHNYGVSEDDVTRSTFGHWTYSSFDCLKVRVLKSNCSDEPSKITLSGVILADLVYKIDQYPILDEDAYFSAEHALYEKYLIEEIDEYDPTLSDDNKVHAYNRARDGDYGGEPDNVYLDAEDAVEFVKSNTVETLNAMYPDMEEDYMHPNNTSWESLKSYADSIDNNNIPALMSGRYA